MVGTVGKAWLIEQADAFDAEAIKGQIGVDGLINNLANFTARVSLYRSASTTLTTHAGTIFDPLVKNLLLQAAADYTHKADQAEEFLDRVSPTLAPYQDRVAAIEIAANLLRVAGA